MINIDKESIMIHRFDMIGMKVDGVIKKYTEIDKRKTISMIQFDRTHRNL
jgi:hypothetical protein